MRRSKIDELTMNKAQCLADFAYAIQQANGQPLTLKLGGCTYKLVGLSTTMGQRFVNRIKKLDKQHFAEYVQ